MLGAGFGGFVGEERTAPPFYRIGLFWYVGSLMHPVRVTETFHAQSKSPMGLGHGGQVRREDGSSNVQSRES